MHQPPVPVLPLSLCRRQLLDWSCTSTTLTLMDWFKLSDIGTSLYFVQWTVQMRSQKRRGERQPRWLKLCQGMLIFTGLLLLLWVPLLLFSSAAPTIHRARGAEPRRQRHAPRRQRRHLR